MSLVLSFRKVFKVNFKLIAIILIALPIFGYAQNKPAVKRMKPVSYPAPASWSNLKTAATSTCPTNPVSMVGQDTLTGNALANGHIFECSKAPFYILPDTVIGNTPCITTDYTNFHNSLAGNGIETFYEGGTDIACLGPAGCAFPIGAPGTINAGVPGAPWLISLYFLDPTKQHDFVFCRQGPITTTTITLTDCWTGNTLLTVPTTPINFGNTNPPNTATCFTVTTPANTDIGTAMYSISPSSASSALIDYHNGQALVNPSSLATGSYVVTYSFTPSIASACTMVTGTYSFSVVPSATVTVNSATVCPGNTATLTVNASGGTTPYTYSWTPSTGLSSTTNTMVTVNNPTVTTVYTVTISDPSGCAYVDTSVVTVRSFTVNKATICSGDSATLIASDNTFTYSWSPATGLNKTTGDTVKASPATNTAYTIVGTSTVCPSLTVTVTDSVIVKLSPTISVLSPTVCSSTTATITAKGATSYTWTPLTNLTASVTKDTVYVSNPTVNETYTVYGTAANGCKDSAVSTIVVSNHLGIISGTPVVRCVGTSFGLTAIGASTYTWTSNDPTNLDFGHDTTWAVQSSVANVGSYTVTISGTSLSGLSACTGTDVVQVQILPAPTITVAPTTAICVGNTATLSASATGSVTVSSYNWSPATTPTNSAVVTASPSSTTIYTVTALSTIGSCASTATVTQIVNSLPSFTIGGNNMVCTGGSSTLTVAPQSTVAATYTWTGGGLNTSTTSIVVTPTATTVYTVNATATTTGCHSAPQTTTVTVNLLPTVTVTPTNTTVCSGNPALLTAGGSGATPVTSYTWGSTSTTYTANANALVDFPATTTIYTVTGQSAFGCYATNVASATITVNTVTVTASSNSPVCKGKPIDLTANTNGTSYTWTASNGYTSTGIKDPTISSSTYSNNVEVYTVIVSSGTCNASSSITVIVDNPVINVSSNATVCPNQMTTLTASSTVGTNYDWLPTAAISGSTNVATVNANPASTTVYTVTGTDAAGCPASKTVTVTVDSIAANMTASPEMGDAPLDVNFINTSVNANSYVWNFGNGSSNFTTSNLSDTAKTIYPTVGTYTATLTVSGTTGGLTCQDQITVLIVVTEHYSLVVPNIFTPNGDGINDNFMVKSEGVSTFSMEIFDRWGLKMFSTTSVTGEWDGKNMGGNAVPADTYFYIVNATSSKTGASQSYKGSLSLIR
jgi:gliding motility-associated-like protein